MVSHLCNICVNIITHCHSFRAATPDVDFDASPVDVTIDAFESNTSTVVSISFQVDLTDDSILEFDEIFTVQFVENSVVDCLDPEANVTITDDGKPM